MLIFFPDKEDELHSSIICERYHNYNFTWILPTYSFQTISCNLGADQLQIHDVQKTGNVTSGNIGQMRVAVYYVFLASVFQRNRDRDLHPKISFLWRASQGLTCTNSAVRDEAIISEHDPVTGRISQWGTDKIINVLYAQLLRIWKYDFQKSEY